MVRVQIQFTESQSQRLREEAAARGVSLSAVVRQAIDDTVCARQVRPSRDELLQRSLAAMGRFRSEAGDVSKRHDEYFADASAE